LNKKACLAVLIFILLTATFGAAVAAKNSNTTCRNNRIEFCSEEVMHNPLMGLGSSNLLKIQQLAIPPFEIEMSKVGEILKIFILSSLLGFSFVMAKRSNLEF
jgi:hypothetical protein